MTHTRVARVVVAACALSIATPTSAQPTQRASRAPSATTATPAQPEVEDRAALPVEHETNFSPLRQSEMIIGLWRIEYGLFDFLTIGTSTPYWIAGAPFGTTFPNIYARLAARLGDALTLGASAGVTYADLGQVYASVSDDPGSQLESRLFIVPVSLFTALNVGWFSMSVKGVYTSLGGDGAAPLDDDSGIGAVAFTDTLQVHLDASVRVTPELAFIGQARYLAYHGPYVASIDTTTAMGRTHVRGAIELDVEGLEQSWAALGGVHLTFGAFDLRAAVGWGRFFLPDVGLVVPTEFVQVDFDAYFRFQL